MEIIEMSKITSNFEFYSEDHTDGDVWIVEVKCENCGNPLEIRMQDIGDIVAHLCGNCEAEFEATLMLHIHRVYDPLDDIKC